MVPSPVAPPPAPVTFWPHCPPAPPAPLAADDDVEPPESLLEHPEAKPKPANSANPRAGTSLCIARSIIPRSYSRRGLVTTRRAPRAAGTDVLLGHTRFVATRPRRPSAGPSSVNTGA